MSHLRTINGSTYLYKSERVGGRPRPRLELAVPPELVEDFRECLAISRKWAREDRERARGRRDALGRDWKRVAGPVVAGHQLAVVLATAELDGLGYHRHARGAWRRRRMSAMTAATTPANIAKAAAEAPERLARAMAVTGADAVTIAMLAVWGIRPLKEASGDRPEVEEEGAAAIELFQEDAKQAIRGLAGPGATVAMQRLAADIVMHELLLRGLQIRDVGCHDARDEMTERRIEAAHRRMLSSMKLLATLQGAVRLAPGVQVNVVAQAAAQIDNNDRPAAAP